MKIALGLVALALCASAASMAVERPTAAAAQVEAAQSAPQRPVCLQVSQIQHQIVVSNTEIRFEMIDGSVWTNTLRRECHGLRFERGFAWDVTGGNVCSNTEMIYVLNRGTPCRLGDFTQVEPAR
jgi:hypothetical protein